MKVQRHICIVPLLLLFLLEDRDEVKGTTIQAPKSSKTSRRLSKTILTLTMNA